MNIETKLFISTGHFMGWKLQAEEVWNNVSAVSSKSDREGWQIFG